MDQSVDGILFGAPGGIINGANSHRPTMSGPSLGDLVGPHVSTLFGTASVDTTSLRFDFLKQGNPVTSGRRLGPLTPSFTRLD
jgi:hypothetical protein